MPRKHKHLADEAAASGGYVVGIGASAGGLEAINEFFDNIPEDTGFSFVVIQHLSPDYKSLMAELLSKHTSMQVIEASEGMPLQANSIYLIPSKKILTIVKGKLQLHEKLRNITPILQLILSLNRLPRTKVKKPLVLFYQEPVVTDPEELPQ